MNFTKIWFFLPETYDNCMLINDDSVLTRCNYFEEEGVINSRKKMPIEMDTGEVIAKTKKGRIARARSSLVFPHVELVFGSTQDWEL